MTKFAQDVEAISNVIDAQRERITKLEQVLREIVYEFDQTYDGEIQCDGSWTGAASIPVHVMRRAQALLK